MSAGFSLGQGVRRAVQLVPQGVAVIDGEHRFTWREFADRTARLAAVFQGHGLKPGGRVALLALNNHWVLECFYAAVHAGGVIVPINFRLSNLELAAQLADCAPEMLILGDGFTHLADDLRQAVPGLHTVFCLGDGAMADGLVSLGEALANAHPAPDAGRSGDDVACLYYTGGTTNAAKGVMITHLNIATNNAHVFPALEFDHHTVHLHHGPLFHTAAGARLFTVTQAAGTHVFLPRFDCGQVLDAIERLRITHTTVVPTMMRMLLDHEAITTTDFSSLRFISYGGAPMPESLMREAVERLPHVKFVQSYGMTELSPVVTMLGWRDHLLEAWGKQRLRSVGRAVLYAEVAVVDDRGQSVPSGERGEIVAKGPMVMKGYWNRPELTASTIRDGWLHTGDIGYLDDDGYLYLVDRKKDMIISGGENVYSLEVEQALETHPAVSQCAVFGRPDPRWGEAVHAVATLKPGADVTPEQLIEHCRGLIAHYKCPRTLEIRDQPMPLSGANKILKTVLRSELEARVASVV